MKAMRPTVLTCADGWEVTFPAVNAAQLRALLYDAIEGAKARVRANRGWPYFVATKLLTEEMEDPTHPLAQVTAAIKEIESCVRHATDPNLRPARLIATLRQVWELDRLSKRQRRLIAELLGVFDSPQEDEEEVL